jgi:diguanylate cyclase (GGDEF)-like protein
MESSLSRELMRAERKERSLGLILLDVDHFKQFNDQHGHSAGDSLLRELGSTLQRATRGDDVACRYGGEEFLVILPEASLEITRQRAQQIREGVKKISIRHEGRELGGITVSLGVAAYPQHAQQPTALLDAADRALYKAKSAGRDCVESA